MCAGGSPRRSPRVLPRRSVAGRGIVERRLHRAAWQNSRAVGLNTAIDGEATVATSVTTAATASATAPTSDATVATSVTTATPSVATAATLDATVATSVTAVGTSDATVAPSV